MKNWIKEHPIWSILMGIFLLFIIVGIFNENDEEKDDWTNGFIEKESKLIDSRKIENNLDSDIISKVTKVIDGDTIEIETGERVRLVCINTPETNEPYYAEAKNFLTDYILNKEVKLVKDVSETDKYGRLLRYIYLEDEFINGVLVEQGYARVYRYSPDTELCDELSVLETKAKNNKLGIWKETKKVAGTNNEYICSFNAYNCGDFKTHAEAQSVYELCGGVSNDVHKLDRDKDGLACETLP